jgi:hypothetical protein
MSCTSVQDQCVPSEESDHPSLIDTALGTCQYKYIIRSSCSLITDPSLHSIISARTRTTLLISAHSALFISSDLTSYMNNNVGSLQHAMESKTPDTVALEQSTSENSSHHDGGKKSTYQKIYNFFGFTQPYNFPLCESHRLPLSTKRGVVTS